MYFAFREKCEYFLSDEKKTSDKLLADITSKLEIFKCILLERRSSSKEDSTFNFLVNQK